MPELHVIRGPAQGKVIEIRDDHCVLGRNVTSDVALGDDSISGRHAEISKRGDNYVLRDLDSTNGTFVNGKGVRQTVLYPGDEILMGETVLRYDDGKGPRETDSKAVQLVEGKERQPTIDATVEAGDDTAIFRVPPEGFNQEDLVTAHRNLAALYQVTAALNSSKGLGDVFERIVTQIFRVTTAERVCIMLIDEDSERLVEQMVRTRDGEAGAARIQISHTIVNHVIESSRGILTTNAPTDERFSMGESIVLANIHSALCVPLRVHGEIMGIIYVDNFGKAKPFMRSDLQLLTALGNEAGLAVKNTMLREANLRSERLAAIGQTVASLSHHIKNVMWCMEGGADIVERDLARDDLDGVRKGWDIVHRNERKIRELVLNMLSYSRERPLHSDPCDLNEVVKDAVASAQPIISEGSIEVVDSLDEALPEVPLDRPSISRCLLNLLTNAADAIGKEPGRIIVSTSSEDGGKRVKITVADTGEGISEEARARIFEPFFSTKGGGGTGLGLAVVRKVMEKHNGELRAGNSSERGAVFEMLLPLRPPHADGLQQSSGQS